MAKISPTERFSIDNQLLARLADLKGARQEHRQACLLLAQDTENDDRKHAVDVLEREIAEHELAIARLEAAKIAQAETKKEEISAQRLADARATAQAVRTTDEHIQTVLTRIVDLFETRIASSLAELDSLCQERTTKARAAAAAVLDRKNLVQESGALNQLTSTSALGAALIAAINRSGLGRVGPELEPYVTVSAPFAGAGTPEQAIEVFTKASKRLHDHLQALIERAANPQPVTEELE